MFVIGCRGRGRGGFGRGGLGFRGGFDDDFDDGFGNGFGGRGFGSPPPRGGRGGFGRCILVLPSDGFFAWQFMYRCYCVHLTSSVV